MLDLGRITPAQFSAFNAILPNENDYQYRIATDALNIKDAYIINIAVEFEIITYQNVLNKREVVLNCIEELKKYFNVDRLVTLNSGTSVLMPMLA